MKKDDSKTHRIALRLNVSEYDRIKRKAAAFGNMSFYIRTALAEFSDTNARTRLDMINNLTEYYERYHSILYRTTSNLNQAIHHANQLAASNLLNKDIYMNEVWPTIQSTTRQIGIMRKELQIIMAELTKLH